MTRTLDTSVGSDLPHRLFQGLQHDGSTSLLVALSGIHIGLHSGDGVDKSCAAAGHNALFHSSLGGSQGILNAQLLLLHLNLSSSAHLDDSHAAGQLGQALLQLLLVKLGRGGFDLAADLGRHGP